MHVWTAENSADPISKQDTLPLVDGAVPLYPFPDLSFQTLTLLPELNVIDVVSIPSTHHVNPGMDCGENPHTDFCDEVIDVAITLSSYLLISLD